MLQSDMRLELNCVEEEERRQAEGLSEFTEQLEHISKKIVQYSWYAAE